MNRLVPTFVRPKPRKRSNRIGRSFHPSFESLEERLVMDVGGLSGLGLTVQAAAIVTDNAGNTIGDLDPNEQRAMASTTKIMTNLIAVEMSEAGEVGLNDEVTVGFYPPLAEGSTNQIGEGEKFDRFEDMLYISLLRSDNEVTQAIGEHLVANTSLGQDMVKEALAEFKLLTSSSITESQIVGNVSWDLDSGVIINNAFAKMMNGRAAQLGMTNTKYRTPHGRDPEDVAGVQNYSQSGVNDGHYSTAKDLAKLGRFAMQNDAFAEIAGTDGEDGSVDIVTTRADGTTRNWSNLMNGNRLIRPSSPWYYPGAIGVKTGATGNARGCLVSQVTILGRTVNAVVLGSGSSYSDGVTQRFPDSHKILDYAFQEKYDFTVDTSAGTVQTRTSDYTFSSRNLTVNGTDGNDVITIYRFANDMWITVNGVSEFLPIADMNSIYVDAKAGNDTVTISGVPAEIVNGLVVDTGAGNDTVNLGTGVGLGIFDNWVAVLGQSGSNDVVNVDDYGTAGSGQSFAVFQDRVERNGEGILYYYDVDVLKVKGTNYADTFAVDSTNAATQVEFTGRNGSDEIVGRNQITTWNITGVDSGWFSNVSFSSVENLTGGTSRDGFKFLSAGSVSGDVNGGGDRDQLVYFEYGQAVTVDVQSGNADAIGGKFSSIERFWGSTSSDTLVGPNADTTWNITSDNNGTFASGLREWEFWSFENLIGGDSADTFHLADGKGVSGLINGMAGSDTIDYSDYTTAVAVNLATRQATNVGGGVWNLENVVGLKDKTSDLQKKHGFQSAGNFYQNWSGWQEKWFKDQKGKWHFIIADGRIYRYASSASLSKNIRVGEVDSSVYEDMTLLFDPSAKAAKKTAAELQAAYGFRTAGKYWQNWSGWDEKWFQGRGNKWFFLTNSGRLYEYAAGKGLNASKMIAQVDAKIYGDLSLLFDPKASASAQSAAQLQTVYGFSAAADAWTNWGGWQEKWLKDQKGTWYFITASGKLYRYGGSRDLTASKMVAQVDAGVYEDLSLLLDA